MPKRSRSCDRTTPRPAFAPDLVTDLRERLVMTGAHLVNVTAAFDRACAALPESDDTRIVRREVAAAAAQVAAALDVARALARGER